MFKEKLKIHQVHGITEKQREDVINFLQGSVYCWCKNKKNEWFAARDLIGGDNNDWSRTPLMALFEKYKNMGRSDNSAVDEAAKDAGRLLKKVIDEDKRLFDTKVEGLVRQYLWE